MIDVHAVATRIIDASRSPIPGNIALQRAVRVTTEKLAECWDDCAATVLTAERSADKTFPPDGEPGNWESMNPYRLALDLTPNGPSAPAVDEPEPNPRYARWHDVDVTEGKSNPERDDHQRHVFITSTDDAELNAMQIIVQALEGLEPRTQQRIIRYVSERNA